MSISLDELDQLVENYLKFRKFPKAAAALADERTDADNNKELEDRHEVIERIMKSLESCDSLRLLTLWDTYVTQVLNQHPQETIAEARVAEFYLHLYCATYPFRGEVLESANTPDVAARYAARSMTIFKHFLEQRGRRLLKMPEFAGIKNLHKIAFPPTHPGYSYLFRSEWVNNTKAHIFNFLTTFFQPPRLYSEIIAVQNVSMMEAREVEIKRMFQQREDKFLQFSRSIYDISHDLIKTLDEGKSVDKEFLHQFKFKFEQFRDVLDAAGVGNESQLEKAKVGGGEVVRKRRKKKNRDHKGKTAPLISDLSYTVIIQDIQSMVGEVEVELNSLGKNDRRMTSIDAEVALQSAMQASAIFNSLNDYLTATADDHATDKAVLKGSRCNMAMVLLENDVFDLNEPQAVGDTTRGSYPQAIMKAFSASFQSLSSYAAKMTAGSPKEKTFTTGDISNTYGILYSASCATVYNMCKLFGGMVSCMTTTDFNLQLEDKSGLNVNLFFKSLCDTLIEFPVTSDNTLENLKIVFLALIAMFSQDRKHKRLIVKNGHFEWISKALEECAEIAMSSLLTNAVFTLCLIIAGSVLEDPEAQRAAVASVKLEKACISMVRIIVKVLVKETDMDESFHIICLRTICNLLKEKGIRDVVMDEMDTVVTPLRNRVHANLSLNPAGEAFNLSNVVLKFTNASADFSAVEDVKQSAKWMDSVTLAEDYFVSLLLHMPDEVNTLDYKNQHPKDSGVKLLHNYTKSYIAEHGSLYDETEIIGDF